MTETPENLTQLLLKASQGDRRALDEILPLVYNELRHIAQNYLSRERDDHTLQATALVHEAYLRLIDQRQVDWQNRSQFFGLAASMMRRILVNHAIVRRSSYSGHETLLAPFIFNFQLIFKLQRAFVTYARMQSDPVIISFDITEALRAGIFNRFKDAAFDQFRLES